MKRDCPNKTCACTGACIRRHPKDRRGDSWTKPVVFLPLMTKPTRVEKGTKYLPDVWKPSHG